MKQALIDGHGIHQYWSHQEKELAKLTEEVDRCWRAANHCFRLVYHMSWWERMWCKDKIVQLFSNSFTELLEVNEEHNRKLYELYAELPLELKRWHAYLSASEFTFLLQFERSAQQQ